MEKAAVKISFKSSNGRLLLTVEADTAAMAFSHLSMFQEIFDYDKCGKCGSTNVRFQTRTPKGYVFHGIKCVDCDARLEFWTNEDGSMFPKLKDKQKQWLPNNGWVVYERAASQSNTAPEWGRGGAEAAQQRRETVAAGGDVAEEDIPF